MESLLIVGAISLLPVAISAWSVLQGRLLVSALNAGLSGVLVGLLFAFFASLGAANDTCTKAECAAGGQAFFLLAGVILVSVCGVLMVIMNLAIRKVVAEIMLATAVVILTLEILTLILGSSWIELSYAEWAFVVFVGLLPVILFLLGSLQAWRASPRRY